MDAELIARGFWGPRQESPDRIADRLLAFLAALDDMAGETLPWSSADLAGALLSDPVNARRVISDAFRANTDAPHLGISQHYDADSERFSRISLGMTVGGYSDSARVHNAVVLKWRGAEALAGPILRQVVAAWDPDWAAVTSRSLLRALADVQPAGSPGPKAGHLTYLSEGRAQVLPDGLDKHLVRLENLGVVIGSDRSDGFLSDGEAGELARILRSSAAFSAVPTSRSKF
ncbi:Imm52 family immunity protein [Kribbella sp. NPDC003557]|uniref:Imm52 family immunity protein n=1 Tax=Kribbella sp. NPDC003557 TaxID=3154449 RepID=UPI0033B5D12A